MIDNFDKIKELLVFDSDDDFYHAQILKRKKEHPELGSNSYVVKTYYIKSVEELEKCKPEMVDFANLQNARVCINLNRRSFEKMAFHTLRKVADIIMNKDYKSVRKAYNSVCGAYSNEPNKKWIIDIDKPYEFSEYSQLANNLMRYKPEGFKVLTTLKTKNGYHLITSPFDIQEYKVTYSHDVQKDNPTILFIP